MACLFCELTKNTIDFLYQNELFYVIPDKYPASKGHSLIIAKNHFESAFDASEVQIKAAFDALKKAKNILDSRYQPDAYNIGINQGVAAGQSINHFHIHLIPRYASAQVHGGIEALLKAKQNK